MSHSPDKEAQELAERYRELSDAALSSLAQNAGALTPIGLETLNRELIGRSMPPVQPLFREDYFDVHRPVVLQRFVHLHEALLAKGQLDSAGIPCFLLDDNMVRIDWFISNLLGGVKLAVENEHEEEAREIMAQPIPENFDVEGVGEYEQPRCPACGSVNISFEALDKPYAYGSAWLGFPIPFSSNRWRCHACGHRWEGAEDDSPASSS